MRMFDLIHILQLQPQMNQGFYITLEAKDQGDISQYLLDLLQVSINHYSELKEKIEPYQDDVSRYTGRAFP